MIDNYTNQVKDVIKFAKDNASLNHCEYVGTEHLLYGLTIDVDSTCAKLLNEFGINSQTVFERITVGNSRKTKNIQESRKYIEAFESAEELRQKTNVEKLGTEFLLYGIIKQSENKAISIIREITNDFQGLFNESLRLVNELYDYDTQDKSKAEYLLNFGKDLNQCAIDGKLDKVVGRENEIERVIQVLGRKSKNNPCIVGEAGVGKTAIVEGIADRIVKGQIHESLKDKRIISLNITSMVAGSKYRGEFEERIKKVFDEIVQDPNIILFIDEIHTIIGAGSAEGTLDVANIIKPLLARGDIRVIGATTTKEYRKYIEKDEALARRFQKVVVSEPSKEETLEILKGIRDTYEKYHNVEIPDDVLESIINLSDRYINSRYFPDKAIDLLDETCTFCKNNNVRKKAVSKEQKLEEAIKENDFKNIIKYSSDDKELEEKSKKKYVITTNDVAKVISSIVSIPVDEISKDELKKLKNLEKDLLKHIIGQDEAIKQLANAIKRGRVGINDPQKPIGSFLFLGPTGCGKSETCKVLSKLVYNNEDDLIKFDMSEYSEKQSVSKLIGSPPGYVGYEEGGLLTEKVYKKPYSIICFDEIEKAHPDIYNILLQILDEGILTDSMGRKVDFKNTIIILTSNIGAKELFSKKSLGFNSVEQDYESLKKNVMSEVKKTFNPEFINRLDEIIIFNKLNLEDASKITDLLVDEFALRMPKYQIKISNKLKDEIIKEGFKEEFGARPLKRAIRQLIENPIADYLIEKGQNIEGLISLDFENNKVTVNRKKLDVSRVSSNTNVT